MTTSNTTDDVRSSVSRVRTAVTPLDAFMRGVSRRLELRKDPVTGTIIVAVRDLTTGKIVRQSPPEA